MPRTKTVGECCGRPRFQKLNGNSASMDAFSHMLIPKNPHLALVASILGTVGPFLSPLDLLVLMHLLLAGENSLNPIVPLK